MTEEEKVAMEKAKNEAQEAVKKMAKEAAKATVAENQKAFDDKLVLIEKSITDGGVKSAEDLAILNKSIAEMQARVKAISQTKSVEVKNMDSIQALKKSLADGIKDSEEARIKYSGGSVKLVEKAINMVASFGDAAGYAAVTTNTLPMYTNPYAPVYLRNIFPNISTDKPSLQIWKRGAITGAAAAWTTGEKATVDPSWEKTTVSIGWIAGVTSVPREVLDDVEFMASEIPNALIYSASGIMAAENAMILAALDSASTAFVDATLTNGLEELLGAAFRLTGEYMTPTHILVNVQDYLKYLVLNKATGSGEYDVPDGKISFIGNQMFINNLIAVPAPGLAAGTAYVVDASQSRFVNRMSIELKMSDEHSNNFTTNMITFRAEERVGFFTYNNASILKVTLSA